MTKLLVAPIAQADTKIGLADTSSALGTHDTMRYGVRSVAFDAVQKHPLERRLAKWEETQANLRAGLHRRVYGLHVPLRQTMERDIVSKLPGHPALPSNNLATDILNGTDETFDFSDFLNQPQDNITDMVTDLPRAMECKMGLGQ
ncbi:proteasome maturation factor UMP1 [Piptocephalis cylindrospora]|uniref:Proteasome maturation factor UMP1 n=1 Tax=Piptocephalis cylindrospora TaxID=1907219 RepID=A0A4P9Y274_9FUNG|nr:proteasome maturation factor UMP1 [Piptocephalis cylindrospora]|eukprot:RKP12927.1 proteasome maturation factor UMP1 [Piptocephalis cylindrospora]